MSSQNFIRLLNADDFFIHQHFLNFASTLIHNQKQSQKHNHIHIYNQNDNHNHNQESYATIRTTSRKSIKNSEIAQEIDIYCPKSMLK